MGQFDRQIETAKRLIAKNGQTVIWRKPAVTTPDVLKPWKPAAATPTDYNDVKICFLPPGRVGQELVRYLKGTEVTTGSVQGLMSAVAFEPSANDIVIRDGKTLIIKSIDPLSPNGQIILYTIEFEEGGSPVGQTFGDVLNDFDNIVNNEIPEDLQ